MNFCDCLSGKRVLVAEDNEINLEILVEFLSEHGANVDVTKDGVELLEKFSNCSCCHYDLILADNSMPRMDGTEAIAEIRQILRGDARRIPIVVISADNFNDVKLKAENAGADFTLGKPYDFMNLTTQVNRLFEEKGDWKYRPTPYKDHLEICSGKVSL